MLTTLWTMHERIAAADSFSFTFHELWNQMSSLFLPPLSIQGKFVAFHLSGFNPAIFIKKFLPKFIAKHLNHISQLSNGAILACLMWLLQLITLKKRIQKQMRKICAPLSFDRATCLGKERTATHTHLFEALLRCLGVWTHYEIPF